MSELQSADSTDPQSGSPPESHLFKNKMRSGLMTGHIFGNQARVQRFFSTRTALVLILFLALGLRLYGINWDQGGLFHPDERAFLSQVYDLQFPQGDEWSEVFDPEASTLNPGSFNWGSLPHYTLKLVHYAVAPAKWMSLFDLRFAGRVLSAVSDTATVALIFMIGRSVFSTKVGLLAALLSSIAVQQVQLSHFFAVDTFVTTFVVATIFYSIRVAQEGRRSDAVMAGVMFGLAMATKFSVLPLLLALITSHLIYATSRKGDRYDSRVLGNRDGAARQSWVFRNFLISLAVAAAVLVITQPFMFLDFGTYVDNISTQGQMVRREVDFPFTRQYEDTPKYVYQMLQLGTWGLGPALGLTVFLGLLGAVVAGVLTRRKANLVILAWVLPYLLITGWFDVKFMRYMMPLTPFLILYGARILWWVAELISFLQPNRRWLPVVPIALVLILTFHYSFSFANVYAGRHPLNEVSRWLQENADTGSVVVQEHWEEGVPGVIGLQMHHRAELYNNDTPQKFEKLTGLLSRADYFVLLSNRLYATIPRLPERYPVSSVFYQKLFAGELGFDMVYSSGRYVGGLGVDYYENPFARVDFGPPEKFSAPQRGLIKAGFGWADESFSVYEHPQTFVFANTDRLSPLQISELIGATDLDIFRADPAEVGLLFSDEDAKNQQSGGTWTSITFLRFIPDWLTPIIWFAAAQMFAFIVLPIAFVVFRPWPDRGYLFAKPLGLVLIPTVTWLLVSARLVSFSFTSVLIAVLLVSIVSYLFVRATGPDLFTHLKTNARRIVSMELLLLIAFVGFLILRAANPDLWHPFKGGEKPMDFAYLNAVVRSSTVPPYDPWYSGGYLNYYYFGQFMLASLIRLTGIVPSVAHTLAVPLLFAFTVGGVYSIVSGLAELTLRARQVPAWSRRSPVYAGLIAAVMVVVAGNIDGLLQILQGAARVFFQEQPFGQFDFWRSSRMMAPDSQGFEITEFPFFTFLFADLHAHLIAIPIAIVTLGASISAYLRIGRKRPLAETLTGLFVLGVLIGSLRTINAWDFPTQLLLGGALLIGGHLLTSPRSVLARLTTGFASVVFVFVAGYLVFLPFHTNFQLSNDGVIASQFRTELWRYIVIHSFFLFLIMSWLVFVARGWLWQTLILPTSAPPLVSGRKGWGWTWRIALVVLAAALVAFALSGFATIAFTVVLGGLTLVVGVVARRGAIPGNRYLIVAVTMVVVAMMLAAGVDIFTIKNDVGRMNTVFKFYLQAWVLLGMAASYFLWVLADAGKLSFGGLRPKRGIWLGLLVVLAVGTMVYPVLGTRDRNATRFEYNGLALDGMAYMKTATYQDSEGPLTLKYDLEGIEWMQQNVAGSPVIIEGLSDLYRWGNRVSIYTGLPSVIGWDWHQRQQRVNYAGTVMNRRSEIDTFYRSISRETAQRLLDKYNVRYVYVGEMERAKYPAIGLAKLEKMESQGLVKVYPPPGSDLDTPVAIYEYISGLNR